MPDGFMRYPRILATVQVVNTMSYSMMYDVSEMSNIVFALGRPFGRMSTSAT